MTISEKIEELEKRIEFLEGNKPYGKTHIAMADFCKKYKVSRPTVYQWGKQGYIKLEKIGYHQFILKDSIGIDWIRKRKGLVNGSLPEGWTGVPLY